MTDHSSELDGMSIRALLAAMLATVICTMPIAALLIVMMSSMRRALLSAEKLMDAHSPYWSESFMPTVLFAIFGLGFGVLIGWRTSTAASLGGPATWLVAVTNIIMLGTVGVIAAPFVFAAGVPGTCWISLGAMAVSSVVGLYFILTWLG